MEHDENQQRAVLGSRISEIRRQRRLSLRDVGEYADVSASFLSQVERGQSGASVGTLMKIASALGVSIPDLFSDGTEAPASVMRRAQRPVLVSGDGFRKTLLTPRPVKHIEACIGEFDPGASTGDPYTHGDSQEVLLVLRGDVTTIVGDQTFEMSQGDSLEYRTSVPHGIENTGESTAEVLWIVSPSTSVTGAAGKSSGAKASDKQAP